MLAAWLPATSLPPSPCSWQPRLRRARSRSATTRQSRCRVLPRAPRRWRVRRGPHSGRSAGRWTCRVPQPRAAAVAAAPADRRQRTAAAGPVPGRDRLQLLIALHRDRGIGSAVAIAAPVQGACGERADRPAQPGRPKRVTREVRAARELGPAEQRAGRERRSEQRPCQPRARSAPLEVQRQEREGRRRMPRGEAVAGPAIDHGQQPVRHVVEAAAEGVEFPWAAGAAARFSAGTATKLTARRRATPRAGAAPWRVRRRARPRTCTPRARRAETSRPPSCSTRRNHQSWRSAKPAARRRPRQRHVQPARFPPSSSQSRASAVSRSRRGRASRRGLLIEGSMRWRAAVAHEVELAGIERGLHVHEGEHGVEQMVVLSGVSRLARRQARVEPERWRSPRRTATSPSARGSARAGAIAYGMPCRNSPFSPSDSPWSRRTAARSRRCRHAPRAARSASPAHGRCRAASCRRR